MANFIVQLENALQDEQLLQKFILDIQQKKLWFPKLNQAHNFSLNLLSNWLQHAKVSKELLSTLCSSWQNDILAQMQEASSDENATYPSYLANQIYILLTPYCYPFMTSNPTLLNPESSVANSTPPINSNRKRKPIDDQKNRRNKKSKLSPELLQTIDAAELSKTIKDKLIQFGIKPDFFLTESTNLNQLGYSEKQIRCILLNHSSLKTVQHLKNWHKELIATFNHEQLTQIIKRGGVSNLEGVKHHYQDLIKLGFTTAQIAKMASAHGGPYTLKAVIDKYKQLSNQLDHNTIVKLVSKDGGSWGVAVAITSPFTKVQSHFTKKQLQTINSHPNGKKNCETLVENYAEFKQLGLNEEEMLKVVNHQSGELNTQIFLLIFTSFIKLGFTKDQIIMMVNHDGGFRNLLEVNENIQTLIENYQLSIDEIVKLASHNGGNYNLVAYIEQSTFLSKLGFTKNQIITIASQNCGARNLAWLAQDHETFIENLVYPSRKLLTFSK
ncbi:TAL effector repeat-containing protein [Legionella jamestowniensis]|uniref:Avirulence protein AvrBs3 n=1 Tax=Legionella jamestowniensis TaxID=455 RepID=A0A0W0UJV3_9GAMM|nr:TAL effector repeat-containing protein [Legionella jamestowniensis]KTD07917.1 Avirulence protein AvrBs3 [Legionella jamestowniensis]SFL64096.1 Xanthomonas avirulence protein, Avr/PthA [Legionella jamestowniensis DSM 19215]